MASNEPEVPTSVDDNKSSCTYEDTLHHLGDFGRYQRRIILLLCLPAISCGLHKLSGVFLLVSPKHRCLLPNESLDATYELSDYETNKSFPWDSNVDSWSSCLRLNVTSLSNNYSLLNISEPCSSWIYDKTEIKSSVTMEWNLVCDQNWLRPLADSSVMLGVLLGAIIFGELSDRYGRKKIYLYSLMLQVLCGFITAVAPNYVSFVILRLLMGASTSGVFLVSYVIALEMVGQKKRMLTGVVSLMFFTIGYMLLAGFSYFIRDWRSLQAALTAPGIIFIIYKWYIPESPRWLITKCRLSEGKEILRNMAKENKVTFSESLMANLTYSDEMPKQKVSLLCLLRYPNMRKISLIIFFNWFVNDVTYYGLSLNTSNIQGNVYLNFLISGLVEFPAYILILLTLNKWGRKPVICGCMLLSGTSLIFTIVVPPDNIWIRNTLYMLGKLAITASYAAMYIFTTEQFPTVIRNAALGASSMCGRIGGIIAPFVNLLSSLWLPLPQLLFGVVSVASGILAFLLPETLNRTLPDTIEESERFSLKKNQISKLIKDTRCNGESE